MESFSPDKDGGVVSYFVVFINAKEEQEYYENDVSRKLEIVDDVDTDNKVILCLRTYIRVK